MSHSTRSHHVLQFLCVFGLATTFVGGLALMIAPVPAAHAVSLARPNTPRVANVPNAFTVCPSTITVMSTTDSGVGSLRDAINTVCDGGTINFSLTLPAIITLTTGALDITRTVTISGPLDPSNLTVSGNTLSRVFSISSGNVTISGLTIEKGHAVEGGGIYNGSSLTLTNSVVFNNTASSGVGGGIYNSISGTLTLSNAALSSNISNQDGGGIRNDGVATLTNTTISGNTAPVAFTGGGGISNSSGGVMTLTGVIIRNNNTAAVGGGILNFGTAALTVTSSSIISNTAATDAGGISNSASLTITNSAVISNTVTTKYGGGVSNNNGTLTMTNVTVNGNYATDAAGGGGAMANYNAGQAWLTNVTIANNTSASSAGGGLANLGGSITISNTLLADNPGDNCLGPITSVGHNLDSANTCSFSMTGDLTNTIPFLGPLANNGGTTLTRALLPGSPAINAGDNSGCPSTDQRGAARPRTAANPCDIGAYEAEYLFLPIIEK